MDNRAAEHYREALRLGQELIPLLRPPFSAGSLGDLEALLALRDAAIQSAGLVLPPGEGAGELARLVNELLEQQSVLEESGRQALAAIRLSSTESQKTRSHMNAVRGLLDTRRSRPRLLDVQG